jgi:hypothetical protein
MATGILKVRGEEIVDSNGSLVILRGAGLGGWLKFVPCSSSLPLTNPSQAWKIS